MLLKVTSHAEQYHGKETGKTEWYAESLWPIPEDDPSRDMAHRTMSVLGRGYTGAEAVADWNRRAAGDGHRVAGFEHAPSSAKAAEKTITTKHTEIGYTNNVEIIERALRERFGIEDNSHLAKTIAAHIWSELVTTTGCRRQDGYEWGSVQIRNAFKIITHRLTVAQAQFAKVEGRA